MFLFVWLESTAHGLVSDVLNLGKPWWWFLTLFNFVYFSLLFCIFGLVSFSFGYLSLVFLNAASVTLASGVLFLSILAEICFAFAASPECSRQVGASCLALII